MEFLHLFILSLVQGVTEFLPISSSGHLVLLPQIMDWPDQGMGIDIAVHVGTLLAVVAYFHGDVRAVLGGVRDFALKRATPDRGLLVRLVVATIPVVAAGFVFMDMIAQDFRNVALIATMSILFGVVLFIADRRAARQGPRAMDEMSVRHALYIGLAQVLALVPGVSRSGITMTAALFLGYSRTDSARFSLLLSMPTIFAAGVLMAADMVSAGNGVLIMDALAAGAMAFVFGYAVIWAMMSWLKKFSFTPFVIYRIALGLALFAFIV